MSFFKDIKQFELHHKIIAFIFIMIMTIVITRLAVFVHNPNPVLLNFELHHFDYGILLLLVSCLLLLFTQRKNWHLLLTGISFGLVIDELWFIRSSIVDPSVNELQIYNSTFLSAVILSIVIILVVVLITHFNQRRKLSKGKPRIKRITGLKVLRN